MKACRAGLLHAQKNNMSYKNATQTGLFKYNDIRKRLRICCAVLRNRFHEKEELYKTVHINLFNKV